MALSRFVLTATITLPPGLPAAVAAGEPGTGGAAGYGSTAITAAAGVWSNVPQTFLAGTVIYADSTAGSNGPQLLYQAIGASNLRAFVDGSDDVGHAALSN